MTTFYIRGYKVEEFIGSDKPVRIFMYYDSGDYRGYIEFRQDISLWPNSIVRPNEIIKTYMPLIMLHPTLDTLRTDKLLNFSVNEQYNWSTLKTVIEPIGEEETSESYS